MQVFKAIEFITTPENGTIKIPTQYIQDLTSEIRVIILINPDEPKRAVKKFDAISISTKDLKFDRDEANQR